MFVAQLVSAIGNPNLYVDSVLPNLKNFLVIANNNGGDDVKNPFQLSTAPFGGKKENANPPVYLVPRNLTGGNIIFI